MNKKHLKIIIRSLQISAMLLLFMTIVVIVHSLLVHGRIILDNLLDGGLIAGVLMVLMSLIRYVGRGFAGLGRYLDKSDRLIDRSTFVERLSPERKIMLLEGHEYILIGVFTILISGFLQILVHFIS